jgi:very-short-patch-repair endonuclease
MPMVIPTWRALGIPAPETEYRFEPKRRWRADMAWPDVRLLVEIEGGAWTFGRHTRGVGFTKDMEKYNAAAEGGWMLLRYQPRGIDYLQISRVYQKLRAKECGTCNRIENDWK